ncbi:acyltransferase [Dactylosporangium aurantiacum]|uniref:Acyltransferase n=1 Tax=Dactylosporangium aurantiacum TaxID=35754 RepID=A0A9Q9IB16_9ACTN|nr:acyltransferase [Dactylosporangium aurantiacum]MDG6108751.1 acyltransferase [Dactylosporangium aurantiacum]UWZ51110.1 acyltransferase [Dactylosporangium aurantiacum]
MAFEERDNGFGAIRLMLAVSVVVAHATSLGFGWEDLGHSAFRGQTNVGTLAVFGFFVLSGLLITRSARRTSPGRFAWHRAVRILPGLWVCLLVTAFVAAPLVAYREHGNLDGFWDGPRGPVQYVWHNWFVGVRQYGIHDLLVQSTPWGRQTSSSVFNGALWSLVYEVLCYAATGLLAVTGLLHRRRRLVLAAAVVLFGVIVTDQVRHRELAGPPASHHGEIRLPLLGAVYPQWMVYLGFLFLAGALVELYADRLPLRGWAGAVAVVLLATSLLAGGFFVVGFPALVYALVWAGARMPRRLRRIGRRSDYSYGIYIYGFVIQQVFAGYGWNRWGFWPYTALSLPATVTAAALSWHLVERHALRGKDWTPTCRSGRSREAP